MRLLTKIHDILAILSKKERHGLTVYLKDIATIRLQVRELHIFLVSSKVWPTALVVATKMGWSKHQISDYTSKLLTHIEDYLMFLQTMEKSKMFKRTMLQDFYTAKGFPHYAKQATNKIDLDIDKLPKSFEHQYILYQHTKGKLVNAKIHETVETSKLYLNTTQQLDNLYYTERLKFYCEAFNRKYFLNEATNIEDFDSFSNILPNHLKSQKLLTAYLQIATLFHSGFKSLDVAFYRIKDMTKEGIARDNWAKEDKMTILQYLLNLALIATQQALPGFSREYILLIDYLLLCDLLDENHFISGRFFKTTITMAIIAGEIDWAKNFLEMQKDKLPEQDQNVILNYCLSLILFEEDYAVHDQEEFPALHLLQKSGDIQHELGIRKLKLKLAVVAKTGWNAIDANIARLRLFVHRNGTQIPEIHLENLKVFLRYLSAFQKSPEEDKLKLLLKSLQLEEHLPVHDKNWFLTIYSSRAEKAKT